METRFHPSSGIFNLLEDDELEVLAEDIEAHGQRVPIVVQIDREQNVRWLLDGRNRYLACQRAGIEPTFQEWDGHGLITDLVWSLNGPRRHLDEGERQIAAARYAIEREREAIARRGARTDLTSGSNGPEVDFGRSREKAAEKFGVPETAVKRAVKVVKDGAPELIAAVESGTASVSAAADIARLTQPEQQEIVARGKEEIKEAAKAIRAEEAKARRAELSLVAAVKPTIPEGRHSVIVIDPPWPMKKIERDVRPNQVEFDYPTMSEEQLVDFGGTVHQMAADDCHLFMWTTQKFLPMALDLLEDWDFRYVLLMVWHKPGGFQPIGLPQYNCEFIVYARRGSPAFIDTRAFNCCFEAGRREHSRKPDEFYDLLARVTDGPRIDVFSREKRGGFSQFGNEADKFSGAA